MPSYVQSIMLSTGAKILNNIQCFYSVCLRQMCGQIMIKGPGRLYDYVVNRELLSHRKETRLKEIRVAFKVEVRSLPLRGNVKIHQEEKESAHSRPCIQRLQWCGGVKEPVVLRKCWEFAREARKVGWG